jgi:lysophospholipase L1-like esterase
MDVNQEKSYLNHVVILISCVLILCVAAFLIPDITIYGYEFKKVDFLKDVKHKKKSELAKVSSIAKEFIDKCPTGYTCIEDYSKDKKAMHAIFESLNKENALSRMAFFGDSFIDGDIFTAEVRKILQEKFGGSGVGFVPIASEIAGFRQTIRHSFSGIDSYNIIENKGGEDYAAGGYYFTSNGKGNVTYSGITGNAKLQDLKNIQLFYSTTTSARFLYRMNGESGAISASGSNQIQSAKIVGNFTNSITFSFPSGEGTKLYGASFEDAKGVIVDNFGMKSNSGIALSKISAQNWSEFNQLRDYKLIVLQFGLNVLGPKTTQLDWYVKSMVELIGRIKQACPKASILILGMPDRSVKKDGEYQTMSSIPLMIEAQREIAKKCGVAFWDLFSGMGGENSMISFVNNKPALANKDYTHLTFAGGEKLASIFTKTFLHHFSNYAKQKNQ